MAVIIEGWYPTWYLNAMRIAPHIASTVVVPPAVEPLTIDQGKLRAGLDWASPDPRDALMEGFIRAARAKVEIDTGLALLEQTRDVFLDAMVGPVITLPVLSMPLQDVVAITWTDRDGDVHTIPPEQYAVDYASGRIWIGTATGYWLTTGGYGTFPAWTIRIVAGYPTVAELEVAAPLLVQAVGLLTAHYATFGRDLASAAAAEVPEGYSAILASYLPVWVT